MAYQLEDINSHLRADPAGFVAECDGVYQQRLEAAADRILDRMKESPIVLLSGPSGSGKTTTALKLEQVLDRRGVRTHTISLDNAGSSIEITDKAGANRVVIRTAEGSGAITIQAANSLTIQVGQTIKLTMNGDSGAVKLTAQQVSEEASSRSGMKTDGMFKLEGAQISETASAMHKIDCSGMVKIGGSPIKLG